MWLSLARALAWGASEKQANPLCFLHISVSFTESGVSMSRQRKPILLPGRSDYWFTWVTSEGKRKRFFLGHTEKEAKDNLKLLEANEVRASRRQRTPTVHTFGLITLDRLAAEFLTNVDRTRSEATYDYHANVVKQFVEWAGRDTIADEIIPLHVNEWIESNRDRWSGTTAAHYISTLQSMYKVGMKLGLLRANPLQYVDKPELDTERFVLTRSQEKRCLEALEDEDGYFGEIFRAMLFTGARPQEARAVTSANVQLASNESTSVCVWHWKAGTAPKGKHARTIWTRGEMEAFTRDRMRTPGPLFRMKGNKPWTANALRLRFMRFREELALPKLVAKTPRHTFCTRLQQAKVDPSHIQVLMGWTSLDMLSTYGHLDRFHLDVGKEFKSGG